MSVREAKEILRHLLRQPLWIVMSAPLLFFVLFLIFEGTLRSS
jgi:hypothetical protein